MIKVQAVCLVRRKVDQTVTVEVEFETTHDSGDIQQQIEHAAQHEADQQPEDAWEIEDMEVADIWDVEIED